MTEYSDPDNGILFLDNEDQLYNPINQRTPPPPMWGEVLEEDLYDDSTPFYDHELAQMELKARKKKIAEMQDRLPPPRSHGSNGAGPKLKRKVIYVYENEDKTNNENDRHQQRP